MTSKQALFNMDQCGIEKIGLMVEFQHVILKDLIKLEKITGYINADDIPDNLKLEIIKNILNEIKGKE
jgi:hypothetical protein